MHMHRERCECEADKVGRRRRQHTKYLVIIGKSFSLFGSSCRITAGLCGVFFSLRSFPSRTFSNLLEVDADPTDGP